MSVVDSDRAIRQAEGLALREERLRLARERLEAETRWLEEAERRLEEARQLLCTAEVAPPPLPESIPLPPPPPSTPAAELPIADELAPLTARPRWLANVPGWLVSLVAHLAVLIVLGLLTRAGLGPSAPAMLEVTIAEPAAFEEWEEVALSATDWAAEAPVVLAVDPLLQADFSADLAAAPVALAGAPTDAEAFPLADSANLAWDDPIFSTNASVWNGLAEQRDQAQFFGIKAAGRKFVFIVDSSMSMRGRRFTEAKRELMYAVRRLDPHQSFYVIFFDSRAVRMFVDKDQNDPEDRPILANMANVRKLEKWIETIEHRGRTDPYEAVRIALAMRPDAMFILSDGQLTDRGRTAAYLEQENVLDDPIDGRRPRVVVHTVGLHSKQGEEALRALAATHQGTYRFVPAPSR